MSAAQPKGDRWPPDTVVFASDRANYGHVVQDFGATVKVRFKSPDGTVKVVPLPKSVLSVTAGGATPPPESNGHARAAGADGKARTGPDLLDDRRAARIVWKAANGFKVSDDIARRLGHEWGEAAILAEQDGPPGIDVWLNNVKVRSAERYWACSQAIEEAKAAPPDEDLEDEQDEEQGPAFDLGLIDSATFFGTKYELRWHVEDILVAGQPCVIGGPKKTLKTSFLLALAIALATGTDFLGKFRVPKAIKVGFFSGESGPATIQETALRICRAVGVEPGELDGIVWGFKLPQLSTEEHLEVLARAIVERGLQVVIIDPLYLCLISAAPGTRRLDPANLFDMGPLLMQVTETCIKAGATPVLIHHFKKNREAPYDTPELEDLAFAGIQEFARQWVLFGRREKYEPGTGLHKLWMTVGGSAGHSGDWGIDVAEGQMGADFQGRVWDVSVCRASEVRSEQREKTQAARAEKQTEQTRARDEAKVKARANDAAIALDMLKKSFNGSTTKTRWKEALNWNSERFGAAVYLLEQELQQIEPTEIKIRAGARGEKPVFGYRVITPGNPHPDSPGFTRTETESPGEDPDSSSPGRTGGSPPERGGPPPSPGEVPGSISENPQSQKGPKRTHKRPGEDAGSTPWNVTAKGGA